MTERQWHLISYDVRDSKRLRQVAKTLEGYGQRIQYSVFRCRLDRTTVEKLHWELAQILTEEDDLLIIPLCPDCAGRIPIHSTGNCTEWVEARPTFRVI